MNGNSSITNSSQMDLLEIFKNSILTFSIFLFYSYQYIIRLLPNQIKDTLESTYSLTPNSFGDFAGSYYTGYVLAHIPLGLLIVRFGGKIIIPITILLTAIGGLLPIMLSCNWKLVVFGRFLSGVGSSCAAVAGFQVFRQIYSYSSFARMIGIMVFCGLLTAKFLGAYFSIFVQQMGLQKLLNALFIFSCVLSLITFLCLITVKNSSSENENIFQGFHKILFHKKILLLSLCAALMIGPIEGFSDAWGSSFFVHAYKINQDSADTLVSTIFTGMAIGALILPYIAVKFDCGYNLLIFAALIMFCALILILEKILSIKYLYSLCLIIGFFSAYQIFAIPMIASFVEANKIAASSTLVNMIVMLFGTFFHTSIGYTANYFKNQSYSMEQYHIMGIYMIPIAMIIAFIILLALKIIWKYDAPKTDQ